MTLICRVPHIFVVLIFMAILAGCRTSIDRMEAFIPSPSKELKIEFRLSDEGVATYLVKFRDQIVIDSSELGFEFVDQPPLRAGLVVTDIKPSVHDEAWEMPWGEQREVVNRYSSLVVDLQEAEPPGRKFRVHFKAYDDGIGFRYHFPEQEGLDTLRIANEMTQFNLTGDHDAWWIPGDWESYEHLYKATSVSNIDALAHKDHPNLVGTHIVENSVNTPVTMRTEDGIHLSFHEANLTDYAGMTLLVDTDNLNLRSSLVGSDRTEYKVKRALPFDTPWRTIQVSADAKGLLQSNLIVNLNEPNKLGDVSWFKPMKYTGVWWELHLGITTWDYASGRHGATTENAKRYIDFAAENDLGGVLVEGWNTGWERWIGFPDREGIFDFTTSYPDYDLEEVVRYGKEKGVDIIMHHETSAAPRTYDERMDAAYSLMQDLGINVVKTGYVGPLLPTGEYHHGQWMVRHYRRALETAAKYNVAINAHEPIKDTGIRRTYPNAISREGLRGQEFNVFSVEGGNPVDHLPTVAFTRLLSGPIDFTPGAFDIKLTKKAGQESDTNVSGNRQRSQVNTTVAQQLALYVVIYSPIQMACDLPEHYEGRPEFQFVRDVGVDWERTIVLDGEVGEYVTLAREERKTGNWFIGAITNGEGRNVKVDYRFLDPDKSYRAVIYKDGPDAHWDDNPESIEIVEEVVTRETVVEYRLAPGGGIAIALSEI